MIRRLVIAVVLGAVAAGCGGASPENQFAPSPVKTMAPIAAENAPLLGTQSIGSCPDGNAPGWLQPWTHGTTARLRWTPVAPTIEYHVVVERYDWTNQYVLVENGDFMTINNTWAELTLPEGRYRAKIQTKSCGKYMGPWSEPLIFSVEGDSVSGGDPAPPTDSAEGTRVFPNTTQSITDLTGAVWTLGVVVIPSNYQVLRDGVYTFGWGSQLKYHNHTVYHLGSDGNWYQWNGSGWTNVGPTEP